MKKVLTTLILIFSLFTTSFAEYSNDEEDLLFVTEIINDNTETFSENIEYCQFVFMS